MCIVSRIERRTSLRTEFHLSSTNKSNSPVNHCNLSLHEVVESRLFFIYMYLISFSSQTGNNFRIELEVEYTSLRQSDAFYRLFLHQKFIKWYFSHNSLSSICTMYYVHTCIHCEQASNWQSSKNNYFNTQERTSIRKAYVYSPNGK